MFTLSGKVALVTGAQRGMGAADARALAAQGAVVVVTDLDCVQCEEVVQTIQRDGGEVIALEMDVTKKDDIDRVCDEVIKKYGHIDILVNNAGIYQPKAFLDLSEEDWDRTMSVNLKGQFMCAQRVAHEMKKQGSGRIVNIASISSGGVGVGVPASVHYTASKGGIIGMTEAMSVDLAPYNILVNAIAPGGIDTPMANPEGKKPEELSGMMQRASLKRIGTPEEVAAAVVFLASDEASYITGTTLYVDGGWLAG